MTRFEVAAARGAQYRAALFLLTQSAVFRDRPRNWIESYLAEDGRIDFPRLLRRDWSTGERLMVVAAASAFGCRPRGKRTVDINLLDLRAGLSAENRQAIYDAIEMAL